MKSENFIIRKLFLKYLLKIAIFYFNKEKIFYLNGKQSSNLTPIFDGIFEQITFEFFFEYNLKLLQNK